MPNLKSLQLRGRANSVTAQGLAGLAKARQLERLEVRIPEIPEGGWAALGSLDQLLHLSTSPAPVSPGIADLAGAGKLESLRIGPGLAEDPDAILAALKKIRSLRSLHVNSVRFGNEPELQKRVRDALPGIDVRHVQ